jgi:hypothetical protein
MHSTEFHCEEDILVAGDMCSKINSSNSGREYLPLRNADSRREYWPANSFPNAALIVSNIDEELFEQGGSGSVNKLLLVLPFCEIIGESRGWFESKFPGEISRIDSVGNIFGWEAEKTSSEMLVDIGCDVPWRGPVIVLLLA